MGLRAFIIKRAIYSFFLVIFVLILNFTIFELMPGNPIEVFAGSFRLKNEQQVQEVLAMYGLDQPLHIRFAKYMVNMLTGYFGISYVSHDYVAKEIAIRLTNTLILMLTVEILSITIGIILGVLAAYKRGGIFDSLAVTSSLVVYSVPSFWLGMLLLLIFYEKLHWFPNAGAITREFAINPPPPLWQGSVLGAQIYIPSLVEVLDRLWHLFLPALTLVLITYGGWLLLTRATMLETLTEDYVVTAKAKGLKERTIIFKHALKNASLPIITSAAMSFGFLLTGAILSEQVFTYPGLGQWTWQSIAFKDFPALSAIFYIIALCVIVANFIADILYGIVDPRVKYG